MPIRLVLLCFFIAASNLEAGQGLSLYVNPRVYLDYDLNNPFMAQNDIVEADPTLDDLNNPLKAQNDMVEADQALVLGLMERQTQQQKRHKTCVQMSKGNAFPSSFKLNFKLGFTGLMVLFGLGNKPKKHCFWSNPWF